MSSHRQADICSAGSKAHKFFGIFSGIAGMALAYGDTVQPEIQASVALLFVQLIHHLHVW